MLSPVRHFMRERAVVFFPFWKRFDRRKLDIVIVLLVECAPAAFSDFRAGRREKLLGMLKTMHRVHMSRQRRAVIALRKSFYLVHVENGVAFEKRNLSLELLAA